MLILGKVVSIIYDGSQYDHYDNLWLILKLILGTYSGLHGCMLCYSNLIIN